MTTLQPHAANDAVRSYWNHRIHDLDISSSPPGSPGFFADLDEYHFDKLHHLLRLVDFEGQRGRKVLDVGCGTGVDLVRFARAGVSLTIPEISDKEQLSRPYVGKLLMILKKSGLIKAVRGRHGGYTLTRPPENISLREIFDALGEPIFGPNHCERFHTVDGVCVHLDDCVVRGIWSRFNDFMNNYYERTTLADLTFGSNRKSIENGNNTDFEPAKDEKISFIKIKEISQ